MVQAVIYFGKEAEGSASLDTLLAPTVYTGQRMRAILRIFHDRRHEMPMFDAVQLVLKGQVSSLVTLGGCCWRIEKPVS